MINAKVGDTVRRLIGGSLPMDLVVTEVTDMTVVCGDWVFDRETGAEIDDVLEWGPEYGATGSYIREISTYLQDAHVFKTYAAAREALRANEEVVSIKALLKAE